MITAPIGHGRGRWHRSQQGVVYACPECAESFVLGAEHRIEMDGAVWPSIECPREGCEFKAFVRLGGWLPPFEHGAA